MKDSPDSSGRGGIGGIPPRGTNYIIYSNPFHNPSIEVFKNMRMGVVTLISPVYQ